MASTAAAVLSKALAKSRSKFEDGTVVRFRLSDENYRGFETRYLYAAIYIATKKAWFLTGKGWGGVSEYSEADFILLLGEADEVAVATSFEEVK